MFLWGFLSHFPSSNKRKIALLRSTRYRNCSAGKTTGNDNPCCKGQFHERGFPFLLWEGIYHEVRQTTKLSVLGNFSGHKEALLLQGPVPVALPKDLTPPPHNFVDFPSLKLSPLKTPVPNSTSSLPPQHTTSNCKQNLPILFAF